MTRRLFTAALFIGMTFLAFPYQGHTAECESKSTKVKAVSLPGTSYISTIFNEATAQLNFEPLLRTIIKVPTKKSCLIAHFSTQARVTDNYIVFQVRVDGVPMEGHIVGVSGTPVVVSNVEDDAEQLTDFPRIFAHNFFLEVEHGEHIVEVIVGAGSNIIGGNQPSVSSPVLTLEY